MRKTQTSLQNEQEKPPIVPGRKEMDWDATKGNFFHLAKISFYFTVSQCEKYITHDDMRDPDAVIIESLRDNTEPIINMLKYYVQMGMPPSIVEEIHSCDWLKVTKENVIESLSPQAKAMRMRKIRLRKQRDEDRNNIVIVSAE